MNRQRRPGHYPSGLDYLKCINVLTVAALDGRGPTAELLRSIRICAADAEPAVLFPRSRDSRTGLGWRNRARH
jgi:hypothetical protein